EHRKRRTQFADLNERLSVGVHVLKQDIDGLLRGGTMAAMVQLKGGGPRLFSARVKDATLLLRDDWLLRKRWSARVEEAIEGYRFAQRNAMAHGSAFTVVVFPDKLTAYADYLQDNQWRATSVIPKLT